MNTEQMEEFEKAKKLCAESKWRDAATILLELRDQVNEQEINLLTTKALFNSEQYKLAYQIMAQSPQAFSNDLELLVQVSLKAQHFISTRIVLEEQEGDDKNELLTLIEEAEENYREKFSTTLQNQLRSFYHLGDYSLIEQRKRLLAADQLPLKEFLTGAKFLLRDPFTQEFVKADILNILQRLNYQEKVVMLAIDDKEHTIIPAQLPVAYQSPVMIKCQDILNQKLESDPQLLNALIIQLRLQAILLNPLIEETITQPEEWVNVMLSRATTGEYSGGSSKIIEWQKRLNNLVDKLQ